MVYIIYVAIFRVWVCGSFSVTDNRLFCFMSVKVKDSCSILILIRRKDLFILFLAFVLSSIRFCINIWRSVKRQSNLSYLGSQI